MGHPILCLKSIKLAFQAFLKTPIIPRNINSSYIFLKETSISCTSFSFRLMRCPCFLYFRVFSKEFSPILLFFFLPLWKILVLCCFALFREREVTFKGRLPVGDLCHLDWTPVTLGILCVYDMSTLAFLRVYDMSTLAFWVCTTCQPFNSRVYTTCQPWHSECAQHVNPGIRHVYNMSSMSAMSLSGSG